MITYMYRYYVYLNTNLGCHRLNHRIHEHTHTAEGTHEWFYQVVKIDTEEMPDSKICFHLGPLSCG